MSCEVAEVCPGLVGDTPADVEESASKLEIELLGTAEVCVWPNTDDDELRNPVVEDRAPELD